MRGASGKRALQTAFTVGGLIAVGTGIFGVVTGADGMPGEDAASESVESELRFLYIFWIAYGAALLRVAPRVDSETWAVRVLASVLFLAGLARALSWATEGRPHGLFVALMVAELVLPPLLVFWQARVSTASPPRTDPI